MATTNQTRQTPCGWYGTFQNFCTISEDSWLDSLAHHHMTCMLEKPSSSQLTAWRNSFQILQQVGSNLGHTNSQANQWTLIFEYELPRERGRRPDVLLFAHDVIFVLEFKDFTTEHQSHIDQVAAYARDLHNYHAASHDITLIPVLILTQSRKASYQNNDVWIASPQHLSSLLWGIVSDTNEQRSHHIDVEAWLSADYAPLPSLIAAARILFHHESLPQIRRAESAGIPQTLTTLVAAAKNAQMNSERHVVLITGVPGAGKTLVGLQLVYSTHFDDKSGSNGSHREAVFLSGNGPLVKVLQHALQNSIFVQDVHGFLKQYGGIKQTVPEEHVWVYDEAQRAWDAERVKEKRGHDASEPEDFLRLGERMNDWALIVGLIGEGQEIHLGEEAGLKQWNEALAKMNLPWTVHCPAKIASQFPAASDIIVDDALDLTESLRSHLAEHVELWTRLLLEGDLEQAAVIAQGIQSQGFDMYVTRSLANAKSYVRDRYADQADKRYGLLASSKAKNLPQYDINKVARKSPGIIHGDESAVARRRPLDC